MRPTYLAQIAINQRPIDPPPHTSTISFLLTERDAESECFDSVDGVCVFAREDTGADEGRRRAGNHT